MKGHLRRREPNQPGVLSRIDLIKLTRGSSRSRTRSRPSKVSLHSVFFFLEEEMHLFPTSRSFAFRQPHPAPVRLFLNDQNVIPLRKTVRMEKESVFVKEDFSAGSAESKRTIRALNASRTFSSIPARGNTNFARRGTKRKKKGGEERESE